MLQTVPQALCAAAVLAASLRFAGAPAAQRSHPIVFPADAALCTMLADRVGAGDSGVGIVVGLIGPHGRRVVPCGRLRDGGPLGGDTVFEIGSVTKVFTALLLADMVRRGEVGLADPVARYTPAAITIPERDGRSITLLDLATHTSALPFMPDEAPASNDSIATKHTAAQLYQFLAHYPLPRAIGALWDYSNLGYWLLAEALGSRAGSDYESLLRTRIVAPLKLQSTAITLSPQLKTKLAVGHDASLELAPPISSFPMYAVMPAAGGVVSTTNDLLTFLGVALGYERSPLAASMALMLSTRRPARQLGVEQALGWVVMGDGDGELIVHDGGTLGYASSLAWDPKQRVGVVVLSNQVASVSDVARHLLRPEVPLAKPTATKHTEITVDAAVLDACTGRYEATGEGVFVIAREADFLTVQLPASWGLPKLRLRPESARDFFVKELPLRITFRTDGDGRVNGLLVYPPRGQEALPANRIGSEK